MGSVRRFWACVVRALNEWLVEEWLERDNRLYGSISIPTEDGVNGAREVERWGGDRRFVQVMMLAGMREPLGHPKYWPIYEAAAAHRSGRSRCTSAGSGGPLTRGGVADLLRRARFCDDGRTCIQTHVASLVYSGVFERFPDLPGSCSRRAGSAWMPAFMWRMDRAWRAMRADVGHLERPPSEVIRERIWFTTQPLDEPETPEYMRQMLEHLEMDDAS